MITLKYTFLNAKKRYVKAKAEIAEAIQFTGLSVEQWVVLSQIPESGISTGELAEKSGVLGPSLSRMIPDLKRLKLVSIWYQPSDIRIKILKLTEHGKKLLAMVKA